MSEQEARETACAIFGGNGDFYSFRKKPKSSSSITTFNKSVKSTGFTESQINRIIEKAGEKCVQFYINSKEFYYYKKNHPTAKVTIEDGLFYAFDSEIKAVKVYPLSAIEHIKIFEQKKNNEIENEYDAWLEKQKVLNITDEELAQAKKDAYNDALDKIEYHSGEPTFDDGWSAAIWYLKKRTTQP